MKKIRTKFIEAINKNESSWINLLILSFIALIIKQYCNYITYRNLNYWIEFYLNSFFTDAIVVLIILWITILNQYIKNRIVKIFNNIICLIIFIIFCIDIFTIYFLQSRVSIFQAFQYVNNWSNGFARPVIFTTLIILVIWTILMLLTKDIKKGSKTTKYILFSIFFLLWWVSIIFNKTSDTKNVISLNISFIKDILRQDKVYAESEEKEEIKEEEETTINYEDYIKYVKWDWKDLNIILVFAESLSAIDSANMWWNNNMPYFDKIQKNWITFTNFVANWTTSDTAHIATLYWIIPLRNIRIKNSPYTWYKLKMQALPKYLNTQWYNTTFISTADLNFLNQREFLSWAWFKKIIWEENFQNNKKYTFDAAPDWDLYEEVIKEVQNQTWKYFIWLQTISFHKSYNTPKWKTEQAALEYADEELYKFYENLEKIWFFESWILIIVWDHRKMNAAENNERDLLWPNRFTRSVATIVWKGIKTWTINDNIIQHTDFYNSIKKFVWHWLVEIDSIYNDVFTQKTNRNRWITNASYYVENWYTISINWETFTFKNLSNLPKDNPIYDYFKWYMTYEFWNIKSWEIITENNKVKIIWHRWSTKNSPENTLQSFLEANKLKANWIEFDVSYTKDHENIILHGEYLHNSNCEDKKVWEVTYEWIRENCKMENWEKFTKLQEMLALIDWLFEYYFLEIKVFDESLWEEQTRKAIQTVKDLNMEDRVIFISYSEQVKNVLNEEPDITYWRDTFKTSDLYKMWQNNNSKYFLAPYNSLSLQDIIRARKLWKEIITYNVNNTWDLQKMKERWISIIMTDEIELLKEYENNQ